MTLKEAITEVRLRSVAGDDRRSCEGHHGPQRRRDGAALRGEGHAAGTGQGSTGEQEVTHDEYYSECVAIAADDCGAVLTKEQIDWIGGAVAGAVENFSMSFGYNVASDNLRANHDRQADEIKQRLEYEQNVHRTRCKTCQGHGFTRDGWGRDFGCRDCNGKGSTPDWPFQYSARK